ncbi:MAG: hypothetical protein GXO09_03810 [Crenarchaeota archaeon]|nr:hypothetical protein [Thermoproteota archaeon]
MQSTGERGGAPRLYYISCILSYFAENRQYGVLDRVANALGPDQAIAALYDALRSYRSNCVKPPEEFNAMKPEEKRLCMACGKDPHELVSKAKYEVEELSKLLLDPARIEEALRLARVAALYALTYTGAGPRSKQGEG